MPTSCNFTAHRNREKLGLKIIYTVLSLATAPKFDCKKEYREYEKCM